MAQPKRPGAKRPKLDAMLETIDPPQPSPALLQRTRLEALEVMASQSPAGEAEAILTPHEAAQFLRIDVQTLLANLAELPAFEFAGRVRFSRSALEQWVRQRTAQFGTAMGRHELGRLKVS
jgi:hypothetical protein